MRHLLRAVPVVVLAALGLAPSSARAATGSDPQAERDDAWLGRDKALHFGVSAGLAVAGYGTSAFVFEDRSARLATGAGLALTLGVAKELNDLAGHGDPSWKDLTWDVIGTATGLAVAYLLDRFVVSSLVEARGGGVGTALLRPPLGAGVHPGRFGVLLIF